MFGEALEAFDKQTLEADHTEALSINRAYDDLIADSDFEGEVLPTAIAQTDHQLARMTASNVLRGVVAPGAYEVGYETAKRAKRWWMYRTAYLEELVPIFKKLDAEAQDDPWQFGLETKYSSYADKLGYLRKEQDYAGTRLIASDPLYLGVFARVEAERQRQLRTGVEEDSPFVVEEHFAHQALVNTFDNLLDQPTGLGDASQRFSHGALAGEGKLTDYSLRRERTREANSYALRLLDPMTVGREPNMRVQYIFIETDTGIEVIGESKHRRPVQLTAIPALKLAKRLSPDQNFEIERPPFTGNPEMD